MAVSQYLRQGSLLDAVRSHFTPDVIRSASSFVGESESSTRQTFNAAAPSMLSGLTNMVSSREGAGNLMNMIRGGGFGSAAENAGSLFGGGSPTTSMLSTGQQLLSKVFGGNSSAVTDVVGRSGGVSGASATKLMALAAPLVLGVLGKRATEQKLDSSGLANALLAEKSDFAAAAPSGLSKLLGSGPTVVSSTARVAESDLSTPTHLQHYSEPAVETLRSEPLRTEPPRASGGMRWVPLAIAALVALGLLMFLRGRTPSVNVGDTAAQGVNATKRALETISLPGGGSLALAPGSINYDVARFLGDSSAQTPKTFVFDNLNFETSGTQLTPESVPTVNNLATILKAYPNAQVALVGFTDNTGTPEANQTLSLNRANAVKGMLADQGIDGGRITAQGLGQERPVAPNDTEEGRARNRRTELTVTSK
jgi:outer membrane protein OmpA-like peptidoglycan-associated protein